MKILKENKANKEDLPVSFLTTFISKSWDEVGVLKDNIESIKKNFKSTKKVSDLLQSLIDAYLVCIGQMELYIQTKEYLELPDLDDGSGYKNID